MHQVQFLDMHLDEKNRQNTPLCAKNYTDHRIWISPLGIFSSSGLYCKAVGAEQKKIGAKKFPILHYIMPPVWTIVIDKGNLIFLHNRHIFVIC